jgi:hypothetical protein
MTDTTAPKGTWQQPHPSLVACDRHAGRCAFRAGDPSRCDQCHATWDAIERTWQDHGPREDHLAAHQLADKQAAAKRAHTTAPKLPFGGGVG